MKEKISNLARLNHANDANKEIQDYMINVSLENFYKEKLKASACMYQLIIVGEALKHVSNEVKNKNPNVKRRYTTSLRNKLAHEYHAIVLSIIYKNLNNDILILKNQIEEIIKELEKEFET